MKNANREYRDTHPIWEQKHSGIGKEARAQKIKDVLFEAACWVAAIVIICGVAGVIKYVIECAEVAHGG
jgi:hypothetical protein